MAWARSGGLTPTASQPSGQSGPHGHSSKPAPCHPPPSFCAERFDFIAKFSSMVMCKVQMYTQTLPLERKRKRGSALGSSSCR